MDMSYIRLQNIERRARHLIETCKKLRGGATNKNIAFSVPLRDLRLSFMFAGELGYCWNHKAASSSFAELFARITNTSRFFADDGRDVYKYRVGQKSVS